MLIAALLVSLVVTDPAVPFTGCQTIPADQVVRVQGARVVLTTREIFPEIAVLPSGDEYYWGCWRNGVLRSLYAPPMPEDGEPEENDNGED